METKIEICRSYSQKLNTGNYTSADFFASAKQECTVKEAESVSKQLFHFCRQMVSADIKVYLSEHPEIQYKEAIINADVNLLSSDPITEEQERIKSKLGL